MAQKQRCIFVSEVILFSKNSPNINISTHTHLYKYTYERKSQNLKPELDDVRKPQPVWGKVTMVSTAVFPTQKASIDFPAGQLCVSWQGVAEQL